MRLFAILFALLVALGATQADAQYTFPSGSGAPPPNVAIDDLPSCTTAIKGARRVVTDGDGATCTQDEGATKNVCECNGSIWVVAGGGSGATSLTELGDVTLSTPATGAVMVKTDTDWIDGQLNLASANAVTGLLPEANVAAAICRDTELLTLLQEDGTQELLGETLGTTCQADYILKSDGSGGLDCEPDTGGASGFDELATGENTTAAMTVGTGASLAPTGSGTIGATDLSCASAPCVADGDIAATISRDSELVTHEDLAAAHHAKTVATDLADGGGDELLGEALATACEVNQILKSDGAGALGCAADSTGGVPSFDSIATGVNTTAAMTVGNNASLTTSGTGTVDATDLSCASAPCVADADVAATISRDSELTAHDDLAAAHHAKTVAADLADGGSDELLGENLATACTVGQILKADDAGALGCDSDAGGSGALDDLSDVTADSAATGSRLTKGSGDWIDQPGGLVLVNTKAELEAAASVASVENSVIRITGPITSGTYSGTTSAPLAADGGDTNTITDASEDWSGADYCGGATCVGRVVCIVDGGTPVESPEGECREISAEFDGSIDVVSAFSKPIIAGTYYVIPDTILLEPYLLGDGKDILRIECGDGGYFKAGGAGAGMMVEYSGVNAEYDTEYDGMFDHFLHMTGCKFQGSDDPKGYDIGLMVTHGKQWAFPRVTLDKVTTSGMNERNADPQTIRSGGTSVYLQDDSDGQTYITARDSIFNAQNPVMLFGGTFGTNFSQTLLTDGLYYGGVDRVRDTGFYASGGMHSWNGVPVEYVGSIVVASDGSQNALDWNGGRWLAPRTGGYYKDKHIWTDTCGDVGSVGRCLASGGDATSLIDATAANSPEWADDQHNGDIVVIRPGEADEEWRKILTTVASTNTITFATLDTAVSSGDWYKIYKYWDAALFVLKGYASLNLGGVQISGLQGNGFDGHAFNPLVLYDGEGAIGNAVPVISGSVVNKGCEITGADPGPNLHTLITQSAEHDFPLAGIDFTVIPAMDVYQEDTGCIETRPFAPSVDFLVSTSGTEQAIGTVRAQGKEWLVKNGMVRDVSQDCIGTYTASGTIDDEHLGCCTITNTGAGADIELELPAAIQGMCVEAVATAAYDLTIDPADADKILDLTPTAGMKIRVDGSTNPGASIRLKAIDTTNWIAVPSDPSNWALVTTTTTTTTVTTIP